MCLNPQVINDFEHAIIMRAFPVDLPTLEALVKFIVILAGERFKLFEHLFFENRLERTIAAQTASEGRNIPKQVEAAQDLLHLLAGRRQRTQ